MRAHHEKHREKRLAKAKARYAGNIEESRALNRARMNAYNARVKAEAYKCPEAKRAYRFDKVLRIHRLTLDQYHAKLESQDFCCPICGTDVVSVGPRQTHIDHDHETGKFRGILCGTCNTGLGKLGDGKHLAAAVRYVAKSARKAA
jgi:hypothetical protein